MQRIFQHGGRGHDGFSPRFIFRTVVLAIATAAALPAVAGAASRLADVESEIQALCSDLRSSVASVEAWGREREVFVGSGVVLDTTGLLITTASVVRGAETIVVRIPGKGSFPSKLLGVDPISNLAVLRIEGASLSATRFAKSTEIAPGSWVMILGNSYGAGPTVAVGILAGRRPGYGVDDPDGLLQVSAPVNPGDSGAALVNSRGEVIGIVCAALTPSQSPEPGALVGGRAGGRGWGSGATVGFAVPIGAGRAIAREIDANGRVTRGFLGLEIRSLMTEELSNRSDAERRGLLVTAVLPSGPAARAGLVAGDLLLRTNGESVGPARELQRSVARARPQTPIRLTVARGDSILDLTAQVGAMPDTLPQSGGRRARHDPKGADAGSRLRNRIEALEKEIGSLRSDLESLGSLEKR